MCTSDRLPKVCFSRLSGLFVHHDLACLGVFATVALGCGELPNPERISDGEFAAEFDPKDQTLRFVSADRVLLRFPPDAWQIGTVERFDDRKNYNPYWLEYGADVLPQGPPDDLVWHQVSQIVLVEKTRFSMELSLLLTGDQTARIRIETNRPGIFSADVFPNEKGEKDDREPVFLRLRPRADSQEAFYGLGGFADDVNHRGKVRPMQQEIDLLESRSNENRVPIPLLLGSSGFGLFVENRRPGVFAVANKEADLIEVTYGTANDSAQGLRFHLLAAPRPLDVLAKYFALTGFPTLPAPWALGPWIWRNENKNQAEVEDDVKKIRDLDLATTAIWIDRPYATRVNSFDFETARYPDPDAMVRKIHAAGLRLALWHAPYLESGSPELSFAEQSGYFPPQTGLLLNKWGKPLDLSNSQARLFWQKQLRKYTERGIEGFKLDYAEDVVVGLGGARSGWRFSDGSDERTMHHDYPLLYHRTYAELLPKTGGFLLCRTGRFGDQANASVIWPGDMDASFAHHREPVTLPDGKTVLSVGGLPATVVMGLNLSLSGFPLFGADTGGYRKSPPDKELYIRWFQQTALSAVMQVGDASSQPPWEYTPQNGRDTETLDLYRHFARLHLRLFPYEWTYLQQMSQTGRPLLRPLGFVFPSLAEHPNDEYFFGDDLLVAPVLIRGARTRDVLFPPGDFVDFETGELFSGQTARHVLVSAPLSKLPLFVRKGALIPLLSPTVDTYSPTTLPNVDSFSNDPGLLHLLVIPANTKSEFSVYDGTTLRYDPEARRYSQTPGTLFTKGQWINVFPFPVPPKQVHTGSEVMSRVATNTDLERVASGWFWSADRGGTLVVKLARNQTDFVWE